MASKEIAALSVSLELNSDNFTKQLQMVSRATNSMEKDFKLAQKELETTAMERKCLPRHCGYKCFRHGNRQTRCAPCCPRGLA